MRIFVCYRREDAAPWAGRLHDSLSSRFGAVNIFQDVEAVRPGESFIEAMDAAVAQADAMLVVIGPRWITSTDGRAGRLEEADDYVRRELEVALDYGKRLLPVLVGGATMPAVGRVPEGLRPIVTRQAVVLHDESWHADIDDLARALDERRPPEVRRKRRLLAAGLVVLLLAAIGVTWAVARGGGGGGDGGTAATEENPGFVATSDHPYPDCRTPEGKGWTDLGVQSRPSLGSGEFTFALDNAGSRDLGAGATEVVFVLTTTVTGPSSENLYPENWTVVADGNFTQSCFNIVGSTIRVDPGTPVKAFVGFTGKADASGIVAVNVAQRGGDTYRVDLVPKD